MPERRSQRDESLNIASLAVRTPSGTLMEDYLRDLEEARSYYDLGLYGDVLCVMTKWRDLGCPGSMYLVVTTLSEMKEYEVAAKIGFIMLKFGAYDPQGAFALAVALNALGKYDLARGVWVDAIKIAPDPIFTAGLACDLSQLGQHRAALRHYCEALQAGYKPTLCNFGNPDLSGMWKYAATQNLGEIETAGLAAPFWDVFIDEAMGLQGLPNQGHSTIAALDPLHREAMAWSSIEKTFVMAPDFQRQHPEVAASVHRELRQRFEANIKNLRSAVHRAREFSRGI